MLEKFSVKSFSSYSLFIDIAVIGGYNSCRSPLLWKPLAENEDYNDDAYEDLGCSRDDVEVISISNNSISNIKESIPSMPITLQGIKAHPDLRRRCSKPLCFCFTISGPHWGTIGNPSGVPLNEEQFQNNCFSNMEKSVPSLPMKLRGLKGAQLPSGDLLVGGGWNYDSGTLFVCKDYLRYKNGSDNWEPVGTMARPRMNHSSVFARDCLFTIGGMGNDGEIMSQNEVITLSGMEKEVKVLPMKISQHTANMLNENQILICGGLAEGDLLVASRWTDVEEQVRQAK